MRVIAGLMTLFYAWCCWLQTNDPDPLVWIALYGYAGAVSLMTAAGRHPLLAAGIGFAAYTLAVLWHTPHLRPGWWESEQGREGVGLLICACWMMILCVMHYRQVPAKPPA